MAVLCLLIIGMLRVESRLTPHRSDHAREEKMKLQLVGFKPHKINPLLRRRLVVSLRCQVRTGLSFKLLRPGEAFVSCNRAPSKHNYGRWDILLAQKLKL